MQLVLALERCGGSMDTIICCLIFELLRWKLVTRRKSYLKIDF